MISNSNIDVIETLSKFKSNGIRVAFVVPTTTGLQKSIMDATKDLRSYLESSGLHNFRDQRQGTINKKLLPTRLIVGNDAIETKTSLYRPETKDGDPRICIYGLKKYANAGDLLAITCSSSKLTIFNCSKTNLTAYFRNSSSELYDLQLFNPSSVALELLDKLKDISSCGFIPSLRKGDTGVGYTLETLLDISENNLRIPDYKGIELKSLRNRNNKGTMFSRVPDWSISHIKKAEDLVCKRGKINPDYGNLRTIFHSINTIKENSYGLKLSLDGDFVHQVFVDDAIEHNDVTWKLDDLRDRLEKKHTETFWIDAESRISGGREEFHYNRVLHTSEPDLDTLALLIETGSVSVDYLLWEKRIDWKEYVRKSGYDFLWKIKKKDRDLLFKSTRIYELS